MESWQTKLAVLYEGEADVYPFQQLASTLAIPLITPVELTVFNELCFLLTWRGGCLMLLENTSKKNQCLWVDIEYRQGEKRTWPMAKQGALAQALGRKTHTVVDATAGWGQDSLAMFRMGYDVISIERSLVMAALLADGYQRLAQQAWVKKLNLMPPKLLVGESAKLIDELVVKPDCIYLDPMFPPKRKKSALAKKSIMALRTLVGDDLDKEQLFATAINAAGKRVVVKSPDYAEPLGGKPDEIFQSKLVRYDVYLK